jgi:TolB protein
MDENGGNITPAVTGPGQDICAEWSPDGEMITYQSNVSGNNEIYVVDLNTKEIRQLTDDPPHFNGSPYWSPDGEQLVFFSDKYIIDEFDYTSTQIFRIDIDGNNLTALTDDFGNWEFPPVWSHDDAKIIFYRMFGTYFKLMILDVSSGELEFLFDDFFPETAWEYAEGRSQVGKYLSFGVLGEEHVMDWETGKVYPIELDAYGFDYYPDVENE